MQSKRKELSLKMEEVYNLLGITRQGHYYRTLVKGKEQLLMEQIKEEVQQYRRTKERRAGSRSLYYNLDIKSKYQIGVSKFESLMSAHKLTLLPLRTRVVTTQSSLQSWNYKNLANGLKINGINQIVAGDLTYIFIGSQLFYLFCLTDLYSNRIVGYCLSDRQRAKEARQALDMWIELRGVTHLHFCIHHTDGGSQYFAKLYLNWMLANHIRPSVAQNCLQNGHAEQKNSLLKHHLIPTAEFQDLNQFQMEIKRIITFYNEVRKQKALGWRSPLEYETYIESLQPEQRPIKTLYDFSEDPKAT